MANASSAPLVTRVRHQSYSSAPQTPPPRDYAFELATANIRFGACGACVVSARSFRALDCTHADSIAYR